MHITAASMVAADAPPELAAAILAEAMEEPAIAPRSWSEIVAELTTALGLYRDQCSATDSFAIGREATPEEWAIHDAASERHEAALQAAINFEPADLAALAEKSALLNARPHCEGMAEEIAKALARDIARLSSADTYLLSLAPELERCMAAERAAHERFKAGERATDESVDAMLDQSGAAAAAIMAVPARTVAGVALQARAISAMFNGEGRCTEFDNPKYGGGTASRHADLLFGRLLAGLPPPTTTSPGVMTFAQVQAETTASYEALATAGTLDGPEGENVQARVWERFSAAPILNPADAAEKLKLVGHDIEYGETDFTAPLVQQVIAYLTSGVPGPAITLPAATSEQLAELDFTPVEIDDTKQPGRLLMEKVAEHRSTLIFATVVVSKTKAELVEQVLNIVTPSNGETVDEAFARFVELQDAFEGGAGVFGDLAQLCRAAHSRSTIAMAASVAEAA